MLDLWFIILAMDACIHNQNCPVYAMLIVLTELMLPYSRKYWWQLNLAVGSQIAILNVLADQVKFWRFGMGSPYV